MSATSAIPTPNPTSPAWSIYIDTQNVSLIGPDGSIQNFTLGQLDDQIYFTLELVASYAFAIGVTGILMIVLLVQLDRKKARRPIFILNFLALFFVCLKAIVVLSAWCSRWLYGIAEFWFDEITQYSQRIVFFVNTISIICELFIYPLILTSLILQVRVVFAAEPKTRIFVTSLLTLAALLVYGTLFAYDVWALRTVYGYVPGSGTVNAFTTLFQVWNIAFIAFVGICCFLFLYKLVVTIQRRKGMGFKSFGPLHVLAIMFGQCLIIPRISLKP